MLTFFIITQDENRNPSVVLKEAVHALALAATQQHYKNQPALWKMGEWGRARTLEDYAHHFTTHSTLDVETWKGYLKWCEEFWDKRGYPHVWLTDGWAIMRQVLQEKMHPEVAKKAIAILDKIPEFTLWK